MAQYGGDYGRQTDEYDTPIRQTDEYGNPIQTGGGIGTGQYGGTTGGGHGTHGGWIGAAITGMVTEKLPGGHWMEEQMSGGGSTGGYGYEHGGRADTHHEKKGMMEKIMDHEKKGMMEKIGEKLPGGHR